MWSEDPVDPEDDLRQGDLLQGFYLPKSKLPLMTTVTAGGTPGPEDFVLSKLGKPRYLLVVSQCCTVANSKVVAVAAIQPTKKLTEDEASQYRNTVIPTSDDDLGYMYSAHVIETHHSLHPEPLPEGRLHIANFLEIHTYSGGIGELQVRRVARMTPIARRDLRRNLSAFWGRVEEEDRKALSDLGEPLS